MTHAYRSIPPDLTQAEKLASVMGEQGIDEVNGSNRAFTLFERFLCGIERLIEIAFWIAVIIYGLHEWAIHQ